MSDQSNNMTDVDLRKFAEHLIRTHATDVEFLTIHEMAEEWVGDCDGINDRDANRVADLIASAKLTIEFPS